MNTTPSPRGWELLLIMVGALAAMTGTTAAYVTHEHAWRYLVVAGCFVQVAGWLRHGRRRNSGAR
ncbi:hypothetical protein ACH3Y9_11580 [Streptomyces sp. WSLK1-5]|uniref:hypothetical protein n=1 Tax=unclassified Streptomyces TaxID=2593676 RepID=UPI00379FCA2C